MIIDEGLAIRGERRANVELAAFNRRSFLFGSASALGALGLGGCMATEGMSAADAARIYAAVPSEKFPIPAADVSKVDPKFLRQKVRYASKEAPGTIIVDPGNHFVYRIEGDGLATRYANVSREGFLWSGNAYVGRKAEWPVWTPPKEMMQRQPESRNTPAACRAASKIRSAHARSISTETAATRSTRSTPPATPRRSGPASRAVAPVCSART